jgi:glycerol kinase
LFNDLGAVQSVAQREFTQIFPEPGWVEHDPEEIVASQIAVALAALAQAHAQPSDVAAIGITNQRETIIVWDRATGSPSTTRLSGKIAAPQPFASSSRLKAMRA